MGFSVRIHTNRPLERNLEVTAKTRPIKIAYIAPAENNPETHLMLDAIFHEAYTRWAGAHTLLIPSTNDAFTDTVYKDWLEFYDPDYIYSYIDISQKLLEEIIALANPILFIKHEIKTERDDHYKYSFNYGSHLIEEPLSSITTIRSLKKDFMEKAALSPTILTQGDIDEEERFISDNFGTSYSGSGPTYPIDNLYNTLLYNPKGYNTYHGTEVTKSINEVVDRLAANSVKTFHELSSICSETQCQTTLSSYSNALQLFVGDSPLDRINFWNSRLISRQIPGSIIISTKLANDDGFIKSLGNYLKHKNFLGHHNNPTVELRSFTLGNDDLETFRNQLKQYTYNQIILPKTINPTIAPNKTSYGYYTNNYQPQKQVFKINEAVTENIIAQNPYHLSDFPQNLSSLYKGLWAIDLEIERENNLSMIANMKDFWEVPKRKAIAQCFSDNTCRINNNHLPTIIPRKSSHPIFNSRVNNDPTYMIISPSDNTFFRCLFLGNDFEEYPKDFRAQLNQKKFEKLKTSDKGQYLQGVISLFDDIDTTHKCLTHKLLRDFIRNPPTTGKNQPEICPASIDSIYGKLQRDKDVITSIQSRLRLNIDDAKKFRYSNFIDALEYLVHQEVFFRVYDWRCENCGHTNIQKINDVTEVNACEICKKQTRLSLDIEWKYKINNFLIKALYDNNGLTVLWALGYLHNRFMRETFFYTPEIEFFDNYKAHSPCAEIDVICIIGGKLYMAEAKQSVAAFFEKQDSVDKIKAIIKSTKPDTFYLIFERYCINPDDEESYGKKIKDVIKGLNGETETTNIELLIASEVDPDFNKYPFALYPNVGKRSREFWDNE